MLLFFQNTIRGLLATAQMRKVKRFIQNTHQPSQHQIKRTQSLIIYVQSGGCQYNTVRKYTVVTKTILSSGLYTHGHDICRDLSIAWVMILSMNKSIHAKISFANEVGLAYFILKDLSSTIRHPCI